MKVKRKKIIKIAIDSPAAAGAGTLAKKISAHYNLYYLDTGKIYRLIAYLKIKFPKKFNDKFIRKSIQIFHWIFSHLLLHRYHHENQMLLQ